MTLRNLYIAFVSTILLILFTFGFFSFGFCYEGCEIGAAIRVTLPYTSPLFIPLVVSCFAIWTYHKSKTIKKWQRFTLGLSGLVSMLFGVGLSVYYGDSGIYSVFTLFGLFIALPFLEIYKTLYKIIVMSAIGMLSLFIGLSIYWDIGYSHFFLGFTIFGILMLLPMFMNLLNKKNVFKL